MSILYVRQSSGKKKKRTTKRLEKARIEHAVFLQSFGIGKKQSCYRNSFPDLSTKEIAATSDNLYVSGGYKHTIHDYKWKRGQEEKKETIIAIEKKSKSIIIPYNKGPTMLLTKADDLTTIGRKV